jgi:hypothetical protein
MGMLDDWSSCFAASLNILMVATVAARYQAAPALGINTVNPTSEPLKCDHL